MRSPEYINRYVAPQAAANGGTAGRLAIPCIVSVPKGAIGVVSLFAVVTTPSVSDPVVGWPRLTGLAYEAELTTLELKQPRILQVAEQGRIPLALGTAAPTARILVSPARALRWWAYAEDPAAIAAVTADAQVILWARALLLDESTPLSQLSQIMAGSL